MEQLSDVQPMAVKEITAAAILHNRQCSHWGHGEYGQRDFKIRNRLFK